MTRSAKLSAEVVRDPTLSDAAKVLLAAIGTYTQGGVGGVCRASQATLAADLGWSDRKIRRHLTVLVNRGLVVSERHGGGTLSVYRPQEWPDGGAA